MTKRCFVIGPMGNQMPRLDRLVNEIITPVVKEFGYSEALTPDESRQGNIMDQVIESLDRADLVIADLTGSNPNVFYEIGVRHSLGLPCLLLFDESSGKPPFDVAAYRYTAIDLKKVSDSQKRLRKAIATNDQNVENSEWLSNPVTNFYRAPMTEVSLANGLAFGYYHNFVLLFARRLYNDQPEILVGPKNNQKTCDPKKIQLKVVIPATLNLASHYEIGLLLKADRLTHAEVRVADKSRPLTLYAHANIDDGHQLVDVPTTMHVMTKAINHRLKRDPDAKPGSNDTEWIELERQEIGRFESTLKRLVAKLETTATNEEWSKKVIPGQISTLAWPFD